MLPVVNKMLPRAQRQVLARFSVSALVAFSLPLLYVSLLRPPAATLAGDTAFWFLMSNCVIAAIVASDHAGTLFFGSKAPAACWTTEGGSVRKEELASTSTITNPVVVDCALPFLVHGERGEVAIEPSTDKNVVSEGQGRRREEEASLLSASDETIITGNDDENAIVIEADSALPESEPEPGLMVVEEEEEMPEVWARAQRSRTPDLQQAKGAGGEGKLRRSATEGSKPAAAEDRDYWELSDDELNRRAEEFIARFNREMRRQIEQEAGGV